MTSPIVFHLLVYQYVYFCVPVHVVLCTGETLLDIQTRFLLGLDQIQPQEVI